VGALAKELGTSFDWVARRVIEAGMRRNRPSRGVRPRPVELDSDDWISGELASGAGIRDLAQQLRVPRSMVRSALRDYIARRIGGDATGDPGGSDPVRRFAAATERVARATVALDRARSAQASAVRELQQSGLTVAAIADRLEAGDDLVEKLLTADSHVVNTTVLDGTNPRPTGETNMSRA
jgi:hypothetical protein